MKQDQKWCGYCQEYTLFAKPHFAFGWGCLLTLTTGCAFFPFWVMFAIADAFRPMRCQRCGGVYLGPRPFDEADGATAPGDESPGWDLAGWAASVSGSVQGAARSVREVYIGLPEWAPPIVWGLGIAAPLATLMFLARAILSRG